MRGTVYIVGAGPGDPGLITVRGRELLARADVVLHDALIDPAILELARPGAARVDVGKTPGSAHAEQESIHARMIAESLAGRVVVRLKGGDPYLFARGSEEAVALFEAGVPFEVVPGVSSPVAASAYAGIPLTHRAASSSVLFVTGHGAADGAPPIEDFTRLARSSGTIVVLMGMRHIAALARALADGGLPADTPVAVVRWAARPDQQTLVSTLSSVADDAARTALTSPAVIVVGRVVSLREPLRWFERLPLFGLRVLVPRAAEQAGRLAGLLREQGALPIEVPAIRILPPDDEEAPRRAVASLAGYDLVAFTSANAVRWFMKVVEERQGDARSFGRARICAIGPGTAEALAAAGLRPDIVPAEHHGEAAARAILAAWPDARPGRILLPRAAVAREALVEILRAGGATVDVVPVYRTVGPDDAGREALRAAAAGADVVAFTSASTVTHTLEALGGSVEALSCPVVASIGPATTAAATGAGLRVDVTAADSTMPGLVAAIAHHVRSGREGDP